MRFTLKEDRILYLQGLEQRLKDKVQQLKENREEIKHLKIKERFIELSIIIKAHEAKNLRKEIKQLKEKINN